MISEDTPMAGLLDEHPALAEFLAAYHPHFEALRGRPRRAAMARMTTVAEAARMAGLPPAELVQALRRASGQTSPPGGPGQTAESAPATGTAAAAAPKPPVLDKVPEARRVELDVREQIGRGEEPFGGIMEAVKALREGEVLVLRAPFEPVPLYAVLARRGLRHWTEPPGAGGWAVWFYREPDAHASPSESAPPEEPATTATPQGEPAGAAVPGIQLDVRGLEPPQPMMRVLEALEGLEPGQTLEVRHDRRPVFLYPQLEARGFLHATDESAPGLVRIVIRRGTDSPAP